MATVISNIDYNIRSIKVLYFNDLITFIFNSFIFNSDLINMFSVIINYLNQNYFFRQYEYYFILYFKNFNFDQFINFNMDLIEAIDFIILINLHCN